MRAAAIVVAMAEEPPAMTAVAPIASIAAVAAVTPVGTITSRRSAVAATAATEKGLGAIGSREGQRHTGDQQHQDSRSFKHHNLLLLTDDKPMPQTVLTR